MLKILFYVVTVSLELFTCIPAYASKKDEIVSIMASGIFVMQYCPMMVIDTNVLTGIKSVDENNSELNNEMIEALVEMGKNPVEEQCLILYNTYGPEGTGNPHFLQKRRF